MLSKINIAWSLACKKNGETIWQPFLYLLLTYLLSTCHLLGAWLWRSDLLFLNKKAPKGA